MLIDKFRPVFAPENEAGTPEPEITEVDSGTPPERDDSQDLNKSSVRKSLEKAQDEVRKNEETARKGDKKEKTGKQPRRVAGGAELSEETPETADAETPEADAEVTPEQPATAAPEAFSKEAKAEWAKVPPTVQAAVLKRETDVARGVEELKGKYKDLDTALTPHMPAIRQNGHTPAQAVTQLFSWFQALAGNPDAAFPALAKSFGYDLAKLVPQAQAAPAGAQEGAQPPAPIPPEVQRYIDDMRKQVDELKTVMGQQLGEVKTTFQRESEAKTNEVLMNWANGKTHFEKVRGLMAQFIQSGAVPLKNGQVDLDGAYDMAVYANPEVRAAVLAEQQAAADKARKDKAAADQKKTQEAADKARKAGVSIGGGAPGAAAAASRPKGKGKSVRDSIMEAREQLTE